MSEMTMRERIEAIREANTGPWLGQFRSLQDFNREHAAAVLALLDEAPRSYQPAAASYRAVYDPEPPWRQGRHQVRPDDILREGHDETGEQVVL